VHAKSDRESSRTGDQRGKALHDIIDRYDLSEFEARMKTRWALEDPDERLSTTELSKQWNSEIVVGVIKSIRDDRGRRVEPPYSPERINKELAAANYNFRYGPEAPDPVRLTEITAWFEVHDKPVEDWIDDFVSHATIHQYLQNHCSVDPGFSRASTPREVQASVKERVQRLKGRTESVVQGAVEQTVRNDLLDPEDPNNEDPDVDIRIQLQCKSCRRQVRVVKFIATPGCPHCGSSD
jgi:hypothetical protein